MRDFLAKQLVGAEGPGRNVFVVALDTWLQYLKHFFHMQDFGPLSQARDTLTPKAIKRDCHLSYVLLPVCLYYSIEAFNHLPVVANFDRDHCYFSSLLHHPYTPADSNIARNPTFHITSSWT
jgi:hypothetical protein